MSTELADCFRAELVFTAEDAQIIQLSKALKEESSQKMHFSFVFHMFLKGFTKIV